MLPVAISSEAADGERSLRGADAGEIISQMDYAEFFRRFGGSTRSNFVRPPFFRRPWKSIKRRHFRLFDIPRTTEIPKGLIRLCPWEAEYLFRVASTAKVGIVETGRFRGGSTFLLAAAAPDVPLHSIDIAPKDDGLLRRCFQETGVGANVDLIVGDSQHTKYPQIGKVDLLFIDGDHTYAGCKADIENWFDHVVPGGHLVFHDSYVRGTYGVQEAIRDLLRAHPEITVVLSPEIDEKFWKHPQGSLCHLIAAGTPRPR